MHIFLRDKSLLTQSHKSDHNNNKKYTRKVNVMQESRPSRTSVYLAIMQTAGWKKKNKRKKIQCARSRVTKIFCFVYVPDSDRVLDSMCKLGFFVFVYQEDRLD